MVIGFYRHSWTHTKKNLGSLQNIMPYHIDERGRKYEVVNTASGRRHGATTKSKASKQMRLLQAIEHGFVPRKR
jgi:hypothetical protein